MTILRNRSDKVRHLDLNNPAFIQAFSKINKSLLASELSLSTKRTLNEHVLAKLTCDIEAYQDVRYGIKSPNPRPFTKLPFSMFRDMSIDGSLHRMLLIALTEAEVLGKSFDDMIIGDERLMLRFFYKVEFQLINSGFLKRPTVFFGKILKKKDYFEYFLRVVLDHGGKIVESEEDASHIVEWNPELDNFPTEVQEDFVRTLEIKSQMEGKDLTLVHWWYHPDSYDEWYLNPDFQSTDGPDLVFNTNCQSIERKWTVCCRFIQDCELFNEWCNEQDYEFDYESETVQTSSTSHNPSIDSGAKLISKIGKNKKKQSLLPSVIACTTTSPALRTAVQELIPESIAATTKMMLEEVPTSILSRHNVDRSNDPSNDILSIPTNIIEIQNNLDGKTGFQIASQSVLIPASKATFATYYEENEDNDPSLHPQKRKKVASGLEAVDSAVPNPGSLSDWYSATDISELEVGVFEAIGFKIQRTDQPLTPETWSHTKYMELRNGIIDLYQQNRSQYLSATDCRRKLAGDVGIIIKVHEFLNAFNLINSDVRAEARPVNHFPHPLLTDGPIGQDPGWTSGWTESLDGKLKVALSQYGVESWANIAKQVGGGKSEYDCIKRFASLKLNSQLMEPTAMNVSNSIREEGNVKIDPSTEQLNHLLRLYASTRLEVLEKKFQLISDVEEAIAIDQERLNIEKKDLLILRAQLSFVQNNITK